MVRTGSTTARTRSKTSGLLDFHAFDFFWYVSCDLARPTSCTLTNPLRPSTVQGSFSLFSLPVAFPDTSFSSGPLFCSLLSSSLLQSPSSTVQDTLFTPLRLSTQKLIAGTSLLTAFSHPLASAFCLLAFLSPPRNTPPPLSSRLFFCFLSPPTLVLIPPFSINSRPPQRSNSYPTSL